MEFTNEFRVEADIETTFDTLVDLERVAPCMPGAVLEEVDGNAYKGRMKVKVGPIQLTYAGTAELVEVDRDAKRAVIHAAGQEQRGSGTASADVTASLAEDGDETIVTVVTDLNVTGKPAQFGRGVMGEIGAKIIGQFADRLRAMLASEDEPEPEAPPAAIPAATGDAPSVISAADAPRTIVPDPTRDDDALDLWSVAGSATVKRALPVVVGVLVVAAIVWCARRR